LHDSIAVQTSADVDVRHTWQGKGTNKGIESECLVANASNDCQKQAGLNLPGSGDTVQMCVLSSKYKARKK
jgi:hypothetical protein